MTDRTEFTLNLLRRLLSAPYRPESEGNYCVLLVARSAYNDAQGLVGELADTVAEQTKPKPLTEIQRKGLDRMTEALKARTD